MASFGESQTRLPYNYAFSDSTAIRVYADSKPHNLKTAPLQKGLILLFRKQEIVGEGVGFGVPLIKYGDQTYYSADASVQTSRDGDWVVIRKEYQLNTVRQNQFGTLQNPKLQRRIESLNRFYQTNKQVAALVLKSKQVLYPFVANLRFAFVPPRGSVIAVYKIRANHIEVDMDFSGVEPENLQQVVVLNEQGAQFFRNYRDSAGRSLWDGEIGVWSIVDAKTASMFAPRIGLSFTLNKMGGSVLRRGREVAVGYLDWAGLDYELPPCTRRFSYGITLKGDAL